MDATNRLIIDLYRSARELPIPEFQERAVQLLKSVCRIESVVCATGSIQPKNGVVFHSVFLHNLPEEFVSAHAYIADQDIVAAEIARNTGRACTINMRDLMPARNYPTVAAFDARFETQNVLGQLNLDRSIGAINGIMLWRGKSNDRFSEDERRLGDALLPHVIEASTINRLVWLNELTANSISRRGVRAIGSAHGILHTHDSAFLDLLRLEWPDWSPPAIPKALFDALQQSTPQRFSGARISIAAEMKHGMLFLLAREKKGMEGLTPAQLAVARFIARGLSYKETAKELAIADATVRNHLNAIYTKLGIDSAAALAHWFSERGG